VAGEALIRKGDLDGAIAFYDKQLLAEVEKTEIGLLVQTGSLALFDG